MQQYTEFLQLHRRDTPLILGNVWDVDSAKIYEQMGFQALGTSSAAIASTLGYEDGEKMTFDELLYQVKRIAANVDIPLSVDIEGGYSRNPEEIIQNIMALHENGVAGINLEDSTVGGSREITPVEDFSEIVKTIKHYFQKHHINIFLNIRTDTYLLGVPFVLENTLERVRAYEEAGADGIFIPGIVSSKDINQVVSATALPVNVMCMPGLPDFDELAALGVKRISMGNFVHEFIHNELRKAIDVIQTNRSFKPLFSHAGHE
ncbi:isocitrate lyase/phosphoenolpyruvate mutase family protein [Fulvivirgaceae bacterium BMA12]|uniref:Isocitrate lyase/phosphoenolpyruvate mutase family protein n=1 Tax=Agaribacillus aureus TaxID=3051825 RepID=A0ABT8L8L5_9BACT|nr:isocitrate lyase/phosphoenolpyruvate mutase family protein [Fulvivirgaceae bacterium BMA12]